MPNQDDAVDITVSSPQICSADEFKPFWVCLDASGRVGVGLGSVPFQNTVAILDDYLYHALRSGVDAVRFIGIGNSAINRRPSSILVRNVMVSTLPTFLEKATMTMYDPIKGFRNALDRDESMNSDKEDMKLWREYQTQCEKAEARAKRFGVEYKQPEPDAFFKWSEARKLRANVSKGFITGIDIMSPEEKQKAQKRKERFEQEDIQHGRRPAATDNDTAIILDDDGSMSMRDSDNILSPQQKRELLPLEQAWDNEELVSCMRIDPPSTLYPSSIHDNLNSDRDPHLIETKIHLFSIDWSAFKQIRTDDITAYFSVYGATYVEWLGELSCNVHFEDKFSAARAMEALSRPLPLQNPVKREDGDVVNDGDVVVVPPDSHDTSTNGTSGGGNIMIKQEADALMMTTNVGGEYGNEIMTSKEDLGSMGWRFCNYPIRKIRSDGYGKRGTRARCLFRIATSLDVLDERPTSRPKPPPGFRKDRVLGPGMDFKVWGDGRNRGGHRHHRRDSRGGGKRRRRDVRDGMDEEIDAIEYQYEEENDYYEASDPYNGWKRSRDSNYYDDDDDDKSMQDSMEDAKLDEFGRSVSALDRHLKASR